MNSRRSILKLSAVNVLASYCSAFGQMARTYRVGALHQAPWNAPQQVALREALRRLGFVEGHNLDLDLPGHGIRPEVFSEHAIALVRSKVDVIHASGDAGITAAQQATSSIPILGVTDDMVGKGFVRSLSNPGGNTTGVSILAVELDAKRLELLMELLPFAKRIALLADAGTTSPEQLQSLKAFASSRGVEVTIHLVRKSEDIPAAIDAAKASGAQCLNVLATPLLFNNRRIIFERVTALVLPAMYQWPEMSREEGLVSYGPSFVGIYREQVARLLAKLMSGSNPADVPVEQPTRFEFVINLKTARYLGLDLSPSILLRADEVIE